MPRKYVKPYEDIITKIIFLEKEILDNSRLTIHQKRDKLAWREALKWVITEEKRAWDERRKEVEKHNKDAAAGARVQDDGKAGGQVHQAE